jgi:hypothetical protein
VRKLTTRLGALFLTGTLLAACASPNREGASGLAADGQRIALGLHVENVAATAELRKLPDQAVVGGIIDLCKETKADDKTCRDMAMDPALAFRGAHVRTLKLVGLMNQRAKVYLALHAVYGAFGKEAAYDARAEMKAAVGQLVDTTSGFVDAAATALGVAKPLGQAALFAVKTLAETWAAAKADADQIVRLEAANETILAALSALKAGMAAEQEYQAGLRGVIGVESGMLIMQLTEEQLVPYAPALQSYLPANVTLPAGAEAKILSTPGLKYGTLRALKERALLSFEIADQNYATLLSSVDALETAHRDYRADRPFDLADLTSILGGLATAIDRWSDLKEQDKKAAQAAAAEAAKKKAGAAKDESNENQ